MIMSVFNHKIDYVDRLEIDQLKQENEELIYEIQKLETKVRRLQRRNEYYFDIYYHRELKQKSPEEMEAVLKKIEVLSILFYVLAC